MSGNLVTTTPGSGRSVANPTSTEDMPRALLEFHSPSAGMIATPIKPIARNMTFVLAGLVFGFLLIASYAPIERVVSGKGVLSSVDSTIVVQPFDQAIIHSIDVRPGDIVQPGQVLAKLDPTLSEADVVNLRHQEQSYSAEVARLTAEAKNADYKPDLNNPEANGQEAAFLQRQAEYRAQINNYAQQIASSRADLAGYQASTTAYAERLRVAGQVQSMRLQLQRDQVGSRLNSLAAEDSVADMQNQEATAIEGANSSRAKIASLQAQSDAYAKNWHAEVYGNLTDAQRKLYQARDDLARADLRHKLVVFRATKPAIVLTIAKVSVGSVLQPGQDFITLMPVDTRYEVEAQVPASESGYVRLGDTVTVKFATLPFVFYGGATGTVTNISADSFTPDNTGASGQSSGLGGTPDPMTTYYKARIVIDKYNLRNTPKSFHLTPGMPVTADIKVGQRTMMEYMLSGVAPALRDGMRDP